MHVLCVIDSLGSGGAQKQIVTLAVGLAERGHQVELFVYAAQHNHFESQLSGAGVTVHRAFKSPGFSLNVVIRLVDLLRSKQYDAVVSFLPGPNFYAAISCAVARFRGRFLTGERSSFLRDTRWTTRWITRWPHLRASWVVANSRTQGEWLRRLPLIRRKISVIYNGYQLPDVPDINGPSEPESATLLVVGRISPEKNGLRLAKALCRLHSTHGYVPNVCWAGRQEANEEALEERRQIDELLAANPEVKKHWLWLGEQHDISYRLKNCTALVHVSLFEGLPNAICEAFAVGCPVIASSRCDHPFLVGEGVRGVLCDPESSEDIARALHQFLSESPSVRQAMRRAARAYAEQVLSVTRMCEEYELLCDSRQPQKPATV
jgi:glycosyltransferase involved in cell wall biosynthesis